MCHQHLLCNRLGQLLLSPRSPPAAVLAQQEPALARPSRAAKNTRILLSSERLNGRRAKTSRKTMRERVPPLQNSKHPHAKWAAKPPPFGALFQISEGWNSLAHNLSRGFCKMLTNSFRRQQPFRLSAQWTDEREREIA